MWGQEPIQFLHNQYQGIIPTRVGTSLVVSSLWLSLRDHPHACGDKRTSASLMISVIGSSPRVWGQETVIQFSHSRCRIIPTRVGTSQAMRVATYRGKDHPHACGDKSHQFEVFQRRLGSSPRVWGQGFVPVTSSMGLRIIPTRVGTSSL